MTPENPQEETLEDIPVRDIREANWFWLNNSIIDDYAATITPIGIAIYAYLARRANKEGFAFPSLTTIATHLGINKSTVAKYINILESENLIRRTRRSSPLVGDIATVYSMLHIPEKTSHPCPQNPQGCRPERQGCRPEGHKQYSLINTHRSIQKEEKRKPSVLSSHEDQVDDKMSLFTQEESCARLNEQANTSPAETLTPPQLIDLYNELTPSTHPKALKHSAGRLAKAKKYLIAFPEPSFWRTVFAKVSASSFLQGKANTPGHKHFVADFEWLLSMGKSTHVENCLKVSEGMYDDTKGGRVIKPPSSMADQSLEDRLRFAGDVFREQQARIHRHE